MSAASSGSAVVTGVAAISGACADGTGASGPAASAMAGREKNPAAKALAPLGPKPGVEPGQLNSTVISDRPHHCPLTGRCTQHFPRGTIFNTSGTTYPRNRGIPL